MDTTPGTSEHGLTASVRAPSGCKFALRPTTQSTYLREFSRPVECSANYFKIQLGNSMQC